MGDHEFRATLPVKDATEAEQVGREACEAYFGDRPYRMNVSTDAIVTVGGQVRGYKADVYAVAGPDEHRTPPDDGEWWGLARPLLWERLVGIQQARTVKP